MSPDPVLVSVAHPRLSARLAASARWSLALAAACAIASLAGWLFGIDRLARFVPGWPSVHPQMAVANLATAVALALLLSRDPRRRTAGRLALALTAFGVLAGMFLPRAAAFAGSAIHVYAGGALLLIIVGAALVTAPGTRQLPTTRLLAAASAALLFIAVIGISFRLLLDLPPLVDISLPTLISLFALTYAVAVARPDAKLIEQPTTHRPGAVITRRLFPAVVLLPLVIAWLELAGEGTGRLDSAFGAVLQTAVTMFALGALVLWGARRLDALDAQRDEAERALRRSHAELDRRVEERTEALERANASLQEIMAAEQRLRHEAERANRAKDEFLAIVSHELRSPLNALRGWGFLLASAKAPDPDLLARGTEAIRRNVDHQARLIDDLLDTSRIMSGKLNIERRPVNLVEAVQGALEAVKHTAAAKRITLVFEPGPAAITLEGDAARLHQIAVNLLSNAVKFTPDGGEVKVTLEAREHVARMTVADTGAGIDAEFLPRVFERFSQADTSSTRRYGGLGIGLALVRHLAELHGGTVNAASDGLGAGSTFTVELPLPQTGAPNEAAAPGRWAVPAVTGALARLSICALDDDPDARDVISLTLEQAGARVRTLGSGAELLALLERELPGERPDVLLMDLAMPEEDGFTVLGRVRALERGKSPDAAAIPVIAVTAFTEVSRERVLEQGFADHVAKPIDAARLVASIREAVRVDT